MAFKKQVAVLLLTVPFFTLIKGEPVSPSADGCNPSPCGINAVCKVINNQTICSCPDDLSLGDPFIECKKFECLRHSHCSSNKSCVDNTCVDGCRDNCGTGASCTTINHVPICYCSPGYTGNPYIDCRQIHPFLLNSCIPSPCGPYSFCKEVNDTAVCSCLLGYVGTPPYCRLECQRDDDCPQNEACSPSFRCENSCKCGENAICGIINHRAKCACPPNWQGDPYVSCKNSVPEFPW